MRARGHGENAATGRPGLGLAPVVVCTHDETSVVRACAGVVRSGPDARPATAKVRATAKVQWAPAGEPGQAGYEGGGSGGVV
jgi:hypothetical protein